MSRTKATHTSFPSLDVFRSICISEYKWNCVKEYRFHPKRMWRFDYAFPDFKIALEVEGGVWTQGRHTRSKGFLGDIEKYNTATLMGWRLLRTVPEDLLTFKTFDMINAAIKGDYEVKMNKISPKTH